MDRRDFVLLSSGAAIGNLIVSGTAEAKPRPRSLDMNRPVLATSGLLNGKPRALKHRSIPGFLSAAQLERHHVAHYGGALKGYTKANDELSRSWAGHRPLGGEKRSALERTICKKCNSVVLHELYFDGMGLKPQLPSDLLSRRLKARFGAVDRWAQDFIATAKASRGWALLMQHPVNGKLYNVSCDAHDAGMLVMAAPLVVLDTYEHAFYIDYQNRKGEYVEKFVEHIDWKAIGRDR